MTTLTAKQRLLVYEELLKVVCEDPAVKFGMCYYLMRLLDGSRRMPYAWKSLLGCEKMDYLPELNQHDTFTLYWAPRTAKGWKTRIGWIEQAIIDVKNQIK